MHDRIQKEISYLRGYLDGDQHMSENQQKVMEQMLTIMDQLAEEHHHLNIRLTELEDYVEAVDEDLNDVEHWAYDEEVDELIEIVCPSCEEEVLIDEEDLQDASIECICPNCHAILITRETQSEPEVSIESR